jgi:Fe-S-cluster-containing dehydrogenase component
MLIDLRRCAGCYACVVACQMQNNTKPGVVWNKVEPCEWGEHPQAGRCYLPHACMQCDEPACVKACPTGASYQREDGITLVNYEKCICCEQCAVACPYGARHLNIAKDYWFESNTASPYESFGLQRSDVVEKCIFCADLVDAGGQPACVANCPGGARSFGDIDDAQSAIAQAAQGALRVDKTGFYYIPVAGLDEQMISDKVLKPKPEPVPAGKKAEANFTPVIAGAGVVAAAAVGGGVGFGLARAKKAGGQDAAAANSRAAGQDAAAPDSRAVAAGATATADSAAGATDSPAADKADRTNNNKGGE